MQLDQNNFFWSSYTKCRRSWQLRDVIYWLLYDTSKQRTVMKLVLHSKRYVKINEVKDFVSKDLNKMK